MHLMLYQYEEKKNKEGKRKQSWKFGGNEFSSVTNQQLKLTASFTWVGSGGGGDDRHKTKTNLLLISTTGISTNIFTSLTKYKPKFFLFPDYPQPDWDHQGTPPLPITWLVVVASNLILRAGSAMLSNVQMQNIKMGPVCRICSLRNFSGLPQMTVNFLPHLSNSKDPTPTPHRQFCQNQNIRISKKKIYPGN